MVLRSEIEIVPENEVEETKRNIEAYSISGSVIDDVIPSKVKQHKNEVEKLKERIAALEREIKMRSLMQSMLIHD